MFCLSLQEESSGYLAVFFLLSGMFSITTPSLFHFYNWRIKVVLWKSYGYQIFSLFLLEHSHIRNSVAHHFPRGLGNLLWLFCFSPHLLILSWKFQLYLGGMEETFNLGLDLCWFIVEPNWHMKGRNQLSFSECWSRKRTSIYFFFLRWGRR